MDIAPIINYKYSSVSVLEDTRRVAEWLLDEEYFAVIDEELETVGIVTFKDIRHEKSHQLIDCAIEKPRVSPLHPIKKVLEIMKAAQTAYLPVYQSRYFCGVISLSAITAHLLTIVDGMESDLPTESTDMMSIGEYITL